MDNIITISSDSSAPNSPITKKKEYYSQSDDEKTIEYFPSVESDESKQELEIAASCSSNIHSLSASDDSDSQHMTQCSDNLKYSSNNVWASSLPQNNQNDVFLLPDQIEQSAQKPKKTKIDKAAASKSKEEKKAQREQRKLESAQNKALKQAVADSRRMRKPGECLKEREVVCGLPEIEVWCSHREPKEHSFLKKDAESLRKFEELPSVPCGYTVLQFQYINVMLDSQILMEPHGGGILSVLSEMSVQYTIQEQIVPLSISWVCESKSHSFDNEMKLQVNSVFQEADEVVLVWHWSKVANEISSNQFIANVISTVSLLSQKKITIIIYGKKDYFSAQKGQRGKHGKTETTSNTNKQEKILLIPKITKKELEMELAELQISYNCNYYFIDSPDHLGTTIAQYTKAIAERPFKQEKNLRTDEEFEWFALGDSRDCVKVDKNGNGLARLWKQQLCQFNLATLATAEAIVSVYSSPKALIEAYKHCSSRREAELLLQDIPIRRGAGPLATSQRIGPELSRQICICFTATDGDETLGRE